MNTKELVDQAKEILRKKGEGSVFVTIEGQSVLLEGAEAICWAGGVLMHAHLSEAQFE